MLSLLAAAFLLQATASLPEGAAKAVAAFEAKVDEVRTRHRRAGPPESLGGELARMVEFDQTARRSSSVPDALSEDEANLALDTILERIRVIDEANSIRLKALIPADGWFRNSRDGPQSAENAWLILQHSSDDALMDAALARMGPLARRGEVSGRSYALLFDRVKMFKGEPQLYGSQAVCDGARWGIWEVENPAGVNARRTAIGWTETQSQTIDRLPIGEPCDRKFVPRRASAPPR